MAETARTAPVVLKTLTEFTTALNDARSTGRSVGVVLTMGALHRGHASLIERAAVECDVVATTIFVNPAQFENQSDLDSYPTSLSADLELASRAGTNVVFAPSVHEMYPQWPHRGVTVTVHDLARRWEGAARPGHFDGMATVVTKLLAASGPCRAYFGEKDYQQLAIVEHLVDELSLPAEVVPCPAVREPDGLALSSRNAHLSPTGRQAAPVLHQALLAGAVALELGQSRALVEEAMADVVNTTPLVILDYATLVDATDLEPTTDTDSDRGVRLLVAAHVDGIRLIDNIDPRHPA